MSVKVLFTAILLASPCFTYSAELSKVNWRDEISARKLSSDILSQDEVEPLAVSTRKLQKRSSVLDIVSLLTDVLFSNSSDILTSVEAALSSLSTANVDDIISAVSTLLDGQLLVNDGTSITVDLDVAQTLVLKQAKAIVKQQIPLDLLQQLIAYKKVEKQVKSLFADLKEALGDDSISLPTDLVQQALAAMSASSSSSRSKRSISTDVESIASNLIKNVVGKALANLVPGLLSINTSIESAIDLITDLSVSSEPSNALLALLAKVVNLVVNLLSGQLALLHDAVNSLADTLLSLSSSSSTRSVSLVQNKSLLTKSVSSVLTLVLKNVWKAVASLLNSALTAWVNSTFTDTLYLNVGKLLLSPVKSLLLTAISNIF